MDGGMILALAIGIPVILFPAAFVWYLNISGLYTVLVETRKRRVAREKRARLAEIKQ
jgi:hypothetical protein